MKLAIDPGHGLGNRRKGQYDPGAVARNRAGETFAEADIALKYGLTLNWLLKQMGVPTFMTRTSSADHCPLRTRDDRAAAKRCTHMISLHLNSFGNSSTRGAETLYRSDKDVQFAQDLQDALIDITGFKNRGVKQRRDLAVLHFKPGPVALVELGFLSNRSDREWLIERSNRIDVCRALIGVLTS